MSVSAAGAAAAAGVADCAGAAAGGVATAGDSTAAHVRPRRHYEAPAHLIRKEFATGEWDLDNSFWYHFILYDTNRSNAHVLLLKKGYWLYRYQIWGKPGIVKLKGPDGKVTDKEEIHRIVSEITGCDAPTDTLLDLARHPRVYPILDITTSRYNKKEEYASSDRIEVSTITTDGVWASASISTRGIRTPPTNVFWDILYPIMPGEPLELADNDPRPRRGPMEILSPRMSLMLRDIPHIFEVAYGHLTDSRAVGFWYNEEMARELEPYMLPGFPLTPREMGQMAWSDDSDSSVE